MAQTNHHDLLIIDVFSQEIVIRVCAFLSAKEIAIFAQTNKTLGEILNSELGLRRVLTQKHHRKTTVLNLHELRKLIWRIDHHERFGARNMDISWINDPQYWQFQRREGSFFDQVAVLLNVCWLDVRLTITDVPRGKYLITWRLKTTRIKHIRFFSSVEYQDEEVPVVESKVNFAESNNNWITLEFENVEVKSANATLVVGFWQHEGEWKRGVIVDYVEAKWIGDI